MASLFALHARTSSRATPTLREAAEAVAAGGYRPDELRQKGLRLFWAQGALALLAVGAIVAIRSAETQNLQIFFGLVLVTAGILFFLSLAGRAFMFKDARLRERVASILADAEKLEMTQEANNARQLADQAIGVATEATRLTLRIFEELTRTLDDWEPVFNQFEDMTIKRQLEEQFREQQEELKRQLEEQFLPHQQEVAQAFETAQALEKVLQQQTGEQPPAIEPHA